MWEWISSATDYAKRNAPGVTPVMEVCRKSFHIGREATTQVNGAVRTKAREIHEWISDDQVRANFTRIATNVSKNGAIYLARYYGGPVIDVVQRSLQETKVDSRKERIHELETRVAKLEKELNSLKTLDQVQIPRSNMTYKVKKEADFNANLNQKPEDVLHIFMTEQFIGTKLLDDLIVPGTGSRRNEKPISSANGQYE